MPRRTASSSPWSGATSSSDPLPLADLALANIASEPLSEVAGRIEAVELVASGYLVSEEPELEGWKLEERKELQGWAADRFSRA